MLYVISLPTQQCHQALDSSLHQANAGDSRSVVSVKGQGKPLSFDHTPSTESSSDSVWSFKFKASDNNIIAVERARITKAGYIVESNRVCTTDAKLSVSRALGDFGFKQQPSLIPEEQAVTADPDVTIHNITEEDEFLVLVCDGMYAHLTYQFFVPHFLYEGIWECLTPQYVVGFVRRQVSQGKELCEIGEMICNHCLAPDTDRPPPCNDLSCSDCKSPFGVGHGCDNMTILIVAILNGRTKEEWYSWITDRVQRNYGHWTPSPLPWLYDASRLANFKFREARAKRERELANCMSAERDKFGSVLPGAGSAIGESAQAGGADVRE
jgi:protein phosphatase 2C family protein 2/3